MHATPMGIADCLIKSLLDPVSIRFVKWLQMASKGTLHQLFPCATARALHQIMCLEYFQESCRLSRGSVNRIGSATRLQTLISATGLTGPAFAETREVLPERPRFAGQDLIDQLAQ